MKRFVYFTFLILIASSFLPPSSAADCQYENQELNIDERYYPPGRCIEIRCLKQRQYLSLGCPPFQNFANCPEKPEDLTKTYPDCCPSYHCNFDHDNDDATNDVHEETDNGLE